MWLELSLISGALMGIKRIYEKELTAHFSNFSIGLLINAFAIPPAAFLMLFFPVPADLAALSWDFWGPLLVIWLALYPVQTYLFFSALRDGELSDVAPMMALLPIFNTFTSYVLIGEVPSGAGVVGVAAIAVGIYLILLRPNSGGRMHINAPALLMAASMVSIAVGSSLDKIAIEASTPAFYSFANITGVSLVFLVLTVMWRQHGELRVLPAHFRSFVLLGLMTGLSYSAAMGAFALGHTSYALAVRAIGFLVPVFWGFLVLRESMTARKGGALALIAAGVVFLAL